MVWRWGWRGVVKSFSLAVLLAFCPRLIFPGISEEDRTGRFESGEIATWQISTCADPVGVKFP